MISALPRLCLICTATALTAAPAPAADEPQPRPTERIIMEDLVVKSKPPKQGDGTTEQFFTITFQEGRSTAKVDSFTVKQGVKPYKLDRVFVKSWSTSGDAGAPTVGPTSLAAASGRQAHPPSGLKQLVLIAQKGTACTVGKRYPSATMTGGGKSYRFTDVTITGCGSAAPEENITFVYGKLIVK